MSVHYKFKNTINYDAVKFDGVYITATDLKSIIAQQKKLNHSELQIVNEETGQAYKDDESIPKNTNVIIIRMPSANAHKRPRLAANHNNHNHNSGGGNHHNNHHRSIGGSGMGGSNNNHMHNGSVQSSASTSSDYQSSSNSGREALELVNNKNMTEEEKIKYIQTQSTKDFDPARYARGRGGGYRGGRGGGPHRHFVPHPGYTCRKCHIPGHSIYDCKVGARGMPKRSSGIPRDFLMKVDAKEKGALMTPSGEYAVPIIDREAYSKPKVEKAPFFEDGTPGDDTPTSSVSVIIASLLVVSTAIRAQEVTGDERPQDATATRSDKLLSINRNQPEGELDLSPGNSGELSNSLDGLNEDEPDEAEVEPVGGGQEKKFSWDYHHENHGVYSGRSLLSREAISNHNGRLKSDGEEDEEEENLDATHSGEDKASGHLKKASRGQISDLNPLDTIDYAEKEWNLMFRSLDMAYDSMSSSIIQEIGKQTNLFEEIVARLKPACRRDINHIRNSVMKHKLWALRMLDSNGKLPSGITYGRFSSPGDYEECLAVQVDEALLKDARANLTERYKFHGKYCLIDFRLPLPERPANKLLSIHESVLNFTGTEIGKLYPEMIGNYSAYASAFYEVGYLHAFCLPSSCDVSDFTRSMGKAIEGTHLIVNNTIDCEERPPDHREPLRKSQILSLFLMAALFLNAFLASLAYHLLNREDVNKKQRTRKDANHHHQQLRHRTGDADAVDTKQHDNLDGSEDVTIWNSIMSVTLRSRFYSECFSIQKNFERLTKPDPRGLTFVHYTRLVAMALTVITHTGALGTLQAITKPADASNSEQIFRDLIPQMLANAFTSIQIFFFMAGFMLVISTFPSIVRDKGHISFLEYAIKRAIRLMPGIAATICLNFLWPLLVDGPMLKYFVRMIVVPCESNWWHTLGFVSNFDHVEKMCLRHSYFSASDYQLHIIAFPLLILLYKQPSLALIMAALLTVAGFVAQVIMILTKTVLPFMMVDYIDKEAFFNVVHYIHHPVWNHMSAFFYGFIVGYLVVKQIRYELSPKTMKCLWYILIPAGIMSIYAPYFWNHYKRPIYKWQMVLYVIFDRSILLTTCAWLSYASMVLARKPPAAKRPQAAVTQTSKPDQIMAPQATNECGKKVGAELATFAQPTGKQPANITINLEGPEQNLNVQPAGGLPRQRSSPNLACIQNQQQQQQTQQTIGHVDSPAINAPRRLSKTMSSSNLATIVETNNGQQASGAPLEPISATQQQPQQRKRSPPPVSNLNTLCLVLSRLTFQLYLFNMVVLWVDVNHSKYYWFFSYYFIIFKGAAVYICSAIMAMIFFVVLESPCLTLYIAWVKSRAAGRAKRQQSAASKSEAEVEANKMPPTSPGGNKQAPSTINKLGVFQTDTLASNAGKPTFSFIDLSSSPTLNSVLRQADSSESARRRHENDRVDQTRM